MLFRSPFERADRVMYLGSRESKGQNEMNVSYPDFQDWRAQTRTFQGLFAFSGTAMVVADSSLAPERYNGYRLTANTFSLVGQQPLLGRDFLADEDRPGAAPVCIIGCSVWESRYGRDPNILGRTIRINEAPATIVGVMPQGMKFPLNGEVWMPLKPAAEFAKREDRNLEVAGRLTGGVSLEQAQKEFALIGQRLEKAYPKSNRGIQAHIMPYNDRFNGGEVRIDRKST